LGVQLTESEANSRHQEAKSSSNVQEYEQASLWVVTNRKSLPTKPSWPKLRLDSIQNQFPSTTFIKIFIWKITQQQAQLHQQLQHVTTTTLPPFHPSTLKSSTSQWRPTTNTSTNFSWQRIAAGSTSNGGYKKIVKKKVGLLDPFKKDWKKYLFWTPKVQERIANRV
jgi:hypothetical protein